MHRRLFLVAIAASFACAFTVGSIQAAPAPPVIVTGLDAGWPDVHGWDRFGNVAHQWASWGEWPLAFAAYDTYQQGVRVAVGDVDGDGHAEIVTAPGKDGFTELRVFDGRTFQRENAILPFKDATWWAGAYVATGDTNGDGRAEVVEGLDSGCCTTLHVLDAVNGTDMSSFYPFGDRSEVGARVASGDVNGDGKAEILAVPVGGTRVSAYAPSGGAPFRSVDAFGSEVTGPISIAAANVVGDARADLVAAAPTYAGAQIKVIDVASGTTRSTFHPYGTEVVSSVAVALGDVNGDGSNDIILSAVTPDGTEIQAIDPDGTTVSEFYVLDPSVIPGASLAAGDLDGDGNAEIVLGGGPTTAPWPPVANGPDQHVVVYEADGVRVGGFAAYPGLFQGGVRVALANVGADARPEIVTAPGTGREPELNVFTQDWVNGRDRGTRLAHFLAFESSFRGGVSVATGDVDGDGHAEIVAGSGPGRSGGVVVFDLEGRIRQSFLAFGSDYTGGLSVAAGDLNADGLAEVVVGTLSGAPRVRAFERGFPYGPEMFVLPGGAGVQVGVADLQGNGRGVILAGAATGESRRVVLLEGRTGTVVQSFELDGEQVHGVRLAGGDLDSDGRDEIVVTPGFGGDGQVRIFNSAFREVGAFLAYNWAAGMNVAVATRIGLPIAAQPRTIKLKARTRTRLIVARFRDAAGASGAALRASINWGDRTAWQGVVISRGGGVYDIRSSKRYARPGQYRVIVTFKDSRGRVSIARSTAVVKRR
jgi:FG-GAP-like repeat/FG-GAP repeat